MGERVGLPGCRGSGDGGSEERRVEVAGSNPSLSFKLHRFIEVIVHVLPMHYN